MENSRQRKVLIVDDDQINLLVAMKYLSNGSDSEKKFHYETVTNGQEALNLINFNKKSGLFFEVILMDLNMPIMDGFEAASRIKELVKNEQIPITPIIAITANTGTANKIKCFNHGMEFFLSKPYKKQELMVLIDEALRNNKDQFL